MYQLFQFYPMRNCLLNSKETLNLKFLCVSYLHLEMVVFSQCQLKNRGVDSFLNPGGLAVV